MNKKKSYLLLLIMIILFSGCSDKNLKNDIYNNSKVEIANINNISYNILLKDNELYIDNGKKINKLVEEKILDFEIYNIDSTKDDELLVIGLSDKIITQNERKFGDDLIIYKLEEIRNNITATEIYREDFSNIKPWMIDAANIDNDEDIEIFVGVYKKTKFYEKVRNRPFYYSWNGKKLYKKWTGSFFSKKDLIDVTFVDFDELDGDETAILERDEEGRYTVSLYSWLNFGFIKIAKSDYYYDVKAIDTVVVDHKDYIEIEYVESGKSYKDFLEIVNGDENYLKLISK